MSPTETSREPGLLEHPAEAFRSPQKWGEGLFARKRYGVARVVIVGRVKRRQQRLAFWMKDWHCLSRTGRRFFTDTAVEQEFLRYLQEALTLANFWEQMETSWVCLDCELMPWSEKAQALLQDQYAAVAQQGKRAGNSYQQWSNW